MGERTVIRKILIIAKAIMNYPIEPAKRLRVLALLCPGAGLFGDVAGAVERALHVIVF
jgi:hypothetical protein